VRNSLRVSSVRKFYGRRQAFGAEGEDRERAEGSGE